MRAGERHYSMEEWIDFARKVVEQKSFMEMQKHLDSGCERCVPIAALWRHVAQAAKAEAAFQPPLGTLRSVKAAFASPKKVDEAPVLVFDNFLQPAFGMRSSSTEARQLLYHIGRYLLDLRIQATQEGRQIVVTGQLLNYDVPQHASPEFSIQLSNRESMLVGIIPNKFGEFRAELTNSGGLELKLLPPIGRASVICLTDIVAPESGETE
jgi:hypothetical protein